jgi:hypothetical protein
MKGNSLQTDAPPARGSKGLSAHSKRDSLGITIVAAGKVGVLRLQVKYTNSPQATKTAPAIRRSRSAGSRPCPSRCERCSWLLPQHNPVARFVVEVGAVANLLAYASRTACCIASSVRNRRRGPFSITLPRRMNSRMVSHTSS